MIYTYNNKLFYDIVDKVDRVICDLLLPTIWTHVKSTHNNFFQYDTIS